MEPARRDPETYLFEYPGFRWKRGPEDAASPFPAWEERAAEAEELLEWLPEDDADRPAH